MTNFPIRQRNYAAAILLAAVSASACSLGGDGSSAYQSCADTRAALPQTVKIVTTCGGGYEGTATLGPVETFTYTYGTKASIFRQTATGYRSVMTAEPAGEFTRAFFVCENYQTQDATRQFSVDFPRPDEPTTDPAFEFVIACDVPFDRLGEDVRCGTAARNLNTPWNTAEGREVDCTIRLTPQS